jgi:hypothetical protein
MTARSLFLLAALLALLSAGIFEARVLLRQREELSALQKRTAESTRQVAVLRGENDAARRSLDAAERNLAAHPAPMALDAATAARQKETNAWLARVKHLKGLFDERPGQRIPEMQWLTDDDWLRVAKRASFDDEHGTRKALGELRDTAKGKFISRLGPALRSFARTTNGEPPASILTLAAHFEIPVQAAILERYEVIVGDPNGGRSGSHLIVREKAPIDADYDSRPSANAQANGNGGSGSLHPPLAWIPDFRARTQNAYRAYSEANQGARPNGMAQVLPFYHPPLDPTKIELILRFERERGP